MKGLLAAVSIGALLTAAPAWAQSLSQQDKTFIHEAVAGNLAEAELGKLGRAGVQPRAATKNFSPKKHSGGISPFVAGAAAAACAGRARTAAAGGHADYYRSGQESRRTPAECSPGPAAVLG